MIDLQSIFILNRQALARTTKPTYRGAIPHIAFFYGRTVNDSLAEYHVPVNRDIGQVDVTVLDIPDTRFNPLGARGIGEIGITGAAAAVANAIYNATGKRDKIMQA